MTPKKLEDLADAVRRLREAAGHTLYSLEQVSGINRSNLSRIEDGTIVNADTTTLNRLARALKVDPEVLYDAAWVSKGRPPLPSPAMYFRSKYGLRADDIAELEATAERLSNSRKAKRRTNDERRSP